MHPLFSKEPIQFKQAPMNASTDELKVLKKIGKSPHYLSDITPGNKLAKSQKITLDTFFGRVCVRVDANTE